MDSSLEGQYANDDATKFVELASKCLQAEARDRPDTKFLITAVSPLQKQKEVTFYIIFNVMLLFLLIVSTYAFFMASIRTYKFVHFYNLLINLFGMCRWHLMF